MRFLAVAVMYTALMVGANSAFAAGPDLEALRSGDMVNVDLVCESLPGRTPFALRLISALITAGFALVLLPAAWAYTAIGMRQTAPSLGWRMDFIHASMIVLFVILALWALLRPFDMLTGRHDGRPVPTSEDN